MMLAESLIRGAPASPIEHDIDRFPIASKGTSTIYLYDHLD